jgi:hypothetical protein
MCYNFRLDALRYSSDIDNYDYAIHSHNILFALSLFLLAISEHTLYLNPTLIKEIALVLFPYNSVYSSNG